MAKQWMRNSTKAFFFILIMSSILFLIIEFQWLSSNEMQQTQMHDRSHTALSEAAVTTTTFDGQLMTTGYTETDTKKIIHILTTGCVGSTYTMNTLSRHPAIFRTFPEPFNTHFHTRYRRPLHAELLQCFFLNKCDDKRIRYRLKLQKEDDILMMNHSTISFKTTQFQRFDILNESVLSSYPDMINQYYVVFLVRDPRATWNSCKKFKEWKESDAQFLCDKFMNMTTQLARLRNAYDLKVMTVYNEFVAGLYPHEYREMLFKFLHLPLIPQQRTHILKEMKSFGNITENIYHSNRWLGQLNFTQIQRIQNIDSCYQWIKYFGYNLIENENFTKSKHDILLTAEDMKYKGA
eukprot:788141_1